MKAPMIFQARQGDVLIQRVRSRAVAWTLLSNRSPLIIASGEATGHAHRVLPVRAHLSDAPAAQLFAQPDGRRFLVVDCDCELRHDEHEPIGLAPGVYSVTLQREYEPEGSRYVVD